MAEFVELAVDIQAVRELLTDGHLEFNSVQDEAEGSELIEWRQAENNWANNAALWYSAKAIT